MSRSSNFILCLLLQPTFLCGRVVNVEDLVETPPEAASTRAEQESWEEIVAHVIIVVVVVVVHSNLDIANLDLVNFAI